MARDSSPLSKRLKALAVRAGLPVESGQTNGSAAPAPISQQATTPDDEQPTGEFPAVAAADAPEDDQPTGEFPVAAATSDDAAPAADTQPANPSSGAVPPPLRDETAVVEEPPRPTVPPIWTDSPPESQSPLTAPPADGPTLAPPTLTSLSKPADPEPTSADEPVEASAAPAADRPAADGPAAEHSSTEPATQLHEVVSDDPPVEEPTAEPVSRVAALDDALALEPEPAHDDAPTTPADPTREPLQTADEQATVSAAAVDAPSPDVPASADADGPAHAATSETPPADTGESDEPAPGIDEDHASVDAPTPPATPTDKLSLTGRIAAIRRRIRPDVPPAPVDATPGSADTGNASAAQPVAPAEEPPPPVTVLEPTPATEVHPDEHLAKPSFSERAALRRRVKTLRARRDAGLLELGAITIDQRRFGDPTAGTLLRRRTDELVDLDNEIAAIEFALEEHASATAIAALGTVRCLGCGTLVGPVDRYCAHCGTPRPTDAAPSDARPDQPS